MDRTLILRCGAGAAMMPRMRVLCLMLMCAVLGRPQTVSLTRATADPEGDVRRPDQTCTEAAPVSGLWYSKDGNTLTTQDANNTRGRWDVKGGRPVRVTLSADEEFAATSGYLRKIFPVGCGHPSTAVSTALRVAGCDNGKVLLLPSEGGDAVREIAAHKGAVRAVAFSTDGVQLASAGADGLVKVWEAKTGRLLATLAGHTGAVLSLAFSPN